jgi:hypothetical protein
VSIETKHDPAKPEPKSAQRRRPDRRWKLAVIGLAGIYVLLAGYDLISNFSEFGMSNVTAASKTVQPAASRASAASPSKAVPAGPAPSAAVSTVSSPASHTLGIASITAFGPEGGSDGDNPGIASRILNAGADKPWYSQWYATPEFGDLRSGTGLLLDMGQTVTVADVRLILGQAPGANVQLRVGDSASLADLTPVASASGAGGTVRLAATTPAQGRYVLLWFIRLPPDGQGHYQVSVYSVSVDG